MKSFAIIFLGILILPIAIVHSNDVQVSTYLNENLFWRSRPDPRKYDDIQYGFVIEDCNHKGNSKPVSKEYYLTNDYALAIYWNKNRVPQKVSEIINNETYKAMDDIRGLFDCTMTVKLGPHDPRIDYQEMMFGFIRRLDFKKSPYLEEIRQNISLLDPENTLANRGFLELQLACQGASRECYDLGCVIIEYGDKVIKRCIGEYENMGDTFKWFTRDDIRIRYLTLGRMIGRDKLNNKVFINIPPVNHDLYLAITRVYGGPCENKQQFQCYTHGICIKLKLACDPLFMYNCPIYSGFKYDEPDPGSKACSGSILPSMNRPDPVAQQSLIIFWVLIGLLLALLTYLILNFCLWRPGYLIWRCGRIRNWMSFGNCCYKLCSNCSKNSCCRTQGKFDTTSAPPIKYPIGDGFHMRENR